MMAVGQVWQGCEPTTFERRWKGVCVRRFYAQWALQKGPDCAFDENQACL